MSFGFGFGMAKASAFTGGPVPSLNLQFAGATTLDPRITFTRASSATYFDSTGVLRNATYNLLLYSEQFDNAIWAKTGSSITANAAIAPDGTLTADALIENTATAQRWASQSVSGLTANAAYSCSVYVKFPSSNRQFGLTMTDAPNGGTQYYGVRLLSGGSAIVYATGFTNTTFSAQNVGNGWYRLQIAATISTVTVINIRCQLLDSNGNQNYTGDGTSGVFIWGAQFEAGSTAGPYYATTTAANGAPRFDYNPTTLAPLGLLIEEQRTNSIRNNTMVGAVAGTPGTVPTNWSVNTSGGGVTREIVGTGTESGITYIDIRVSGTTTGALFFGIRPEVPTQVAAANGQTWTSTFYVRLVAGSLANITRLNHAIQYNDAAGNPLTFGTGDITPTNAALNTQRFTRTTTAINASTAFVQSNVQIEANSGVAIDITLRIGLPQLEQGAFATSVIPTTGTAATRAADSAVVTGSNFSSWYRQDAGALYADVQIGYTIPASSFPASVSLNDGTTNNSIHLWNFIVSGNNRTGGYVINGGVVQADMATAFSSAALGKAAVAYQVNDFAAVSNGGAATTDASGTLPTATQMNIGALASGSGRLNGTIRRIAFYPARLANATLQALTT